MRCQEATWTDLESIWEAKRVQNGRRGGSQKWAEMSWVECCEVEWSWVKLSGVRGSEKRNEGVWAQNAPRPLEELGETKRLQESPKKPKKEPKRLQKHKKEPLRTPQKPKRSCIRPQSAKQRPDRNWKVPMALHRICHDVCWDHKPLNIEASNISTSKLPRRVPRSANHFLWNL